MEVLSSRIIVGVTDLACSRQFYEETLGLRVFREYGARGVVSGVVYFLGGAFLELTAASTETSGSSVVIWIQVPSVANEEARLVTAGVAIRKPAERMPWGLIECWIEDPDGVELRLVEVPDDHPLRRRLS
ncbi:MAG: VOC family protein [Acidimicrobiales bacterium]